MAPEDARQGDKLERKVIAKAIQKHLDVKGLKRAHLVRRDLSEATINKVFQGVFTDRTLNKIEAILQTSFHAHVDVEDEAPEHIGGYALHMVRSIQGRYLCVRPLFNDPSVFNSFGIEISWSKRERCLTFQEFARQDSQFTQSGIVYIPFGRPFMNLVTTDRGSIRTIFVSFPEEPTGLSRGVVMTLHNPKPGSYVPAVGPIFLRRFNDNEAPRFGIVKSEHSAYSEYKSILRSVLTDECAIFATSITSEDLRQRKLSAVNT
jgi:hypothetical protein